MKFHPLAVLLLITLATTSLSASPETDQKAADAANKAYNIRALIKNPSITVADGVATLSGTADTAEAKSIAAETVGNLAGVTRVENNILVNPEIAVHSDAWIAASIRLDIYFRGNINITAEVINVKEGVVTLGGTVNTAAENDLAEFYAKNTEGVTSVKNQIGVRKTTVEANAPATPEPIAGVRTIDDASLTVQVRYALMYDRSTKSVKTSLSTKGGVVAIAGEAASEAEKSQVSKVALSVHGVKSVDNTMTVAKAVAADSKPEEK